jgi:hypothetical protein
MAFVRGAFPILANGDTPGTQEFGVPFVLTESILFIIRRESGLEFSIWISVSGTG